MARPMTNSEIRDPARPRTREAKRALLFGSGLIAAALLLGGAGVVLMGAGQFYAVVLLLIAPLMGYWGKRLTRRADIR